MNKLINNSLWRTLKAYFNRRISLNPDVLIDTSTDTIILINSDNMIAAFNQAAVKEFGYLKEEVLGLPIDIIFEESSHSLNKLTVLDLEKIGDKRALKAIRKDGSVFSIHLILTELKFGSEALFFAIIRDITSKHEELLLEAEANAKSDYISILGHELRTPIAAIQGALGLLVHSNEASEKCQELLKIAHRNTERLGKIINILLDLDKLCNGNHVILTDTILIPLIKEAISVSKYIAEKKEVRFIEKYPEHQDIHVLSDYDKLMQVCLNLLSNAVKSSPVGEDIVISLNIFPDKVRVSVEDRGAGVPNRFHSKLFSSFAQAEKGEKKQEGLGLGLHLSRKIIDLLGGSIGYIPNDKTGSVFYFELPLVTEESKAMQANNIEERNAS